MLLEMEEPKHYQVGRDFVVTLTVPDRHPATYFVATFTGPIGKKINEPTVLRTRNDSQMPRGQGPNTYVLRGPIPEGTPLGTYHLTGIAVHWSAGGLEPQEIPESGLPHLQIVIDPYVPEAPPELPKITKAE